LELCSSGEQEDHVFGGYLLLDALSEIRWSASLRIGVRGQATRDMLRRPSCPSLCRSSCSPPPSPPLRTERRRAVGASSWRRPPRGAGPLGITRRTADRPSSELNAAAVLQALGRPLQAGRARPRRPGDRASSVFRRPPEARRDARAGAGGGGGRGRRAARGQALSRHPSHPCRRRRPHPPHLL